MGKFYSMTIYEALEEIRKQNYLLPVFQRDFKWCNDGTEKIEKLFDSLMSDYPISSMLFWKINRDSCNGIKFYHFNEIAVENPERVKNNPYAQNPCKQLPSTDFYAVLDGQQRLTALRIGIYGEFFEHKKNKTWDFKKGEFIRKVLYFNISVEKDKTHDYDFEFKSEHDENIFEECGNKWLKVNSIDDYNRKYTEDNIDVTDYYDEFSLNAIEKKNINKLRKIIFDEELINYYEEKTNDVDRAMRIFTRINNEGEPLSFPEIIYSIIKANWTKKDARKEIENLIEAEKNNGFNLDIEYIVKSFLFLFNENIKNEIKSFDDDFCLLIEKNWENIRKSIQQTFNLLKTYGMIEENLLSYNATLPILYYIYHKGYYKNFSTAKKFESERQEIKKWLYQALLRHFFSHQTDTILNEIRNNFSPKIKSNIYIGPSFKFDSKTINKNTTYYTTIAQEELDALLDTRKDNRNAFLILSLLYPNIDYRKEIIVHKDHLHNKERYKDLSQPIKDKYPFEKYDSIVNLQLLTESENTSKNAALLSDWVDAEVKKICGTSAKRISSERKIFLNKQIIPDVNLGLQNFDEFYKKRKKMLQEKLEALI